MIKKILCCYVAVILCGSSAGAAEKLARIDFENAAVVDVIQTLAKGAGFDLVLSGDQTALQGKKATIHLKEIPVEEAIDHILKTNGFTYEKKGKVILVSSLPQDLVQTAYQPESEVVILKYLSAAKAATLLGKLMPAANFQSGERANELLLRGKAAEIKEAKNILSSIDHLAPQILIESKVVELSQSDSLKLGVSYGNGAVKFVTDKTSKKTSLADNLISTVNGLISDGKANVIASPRVATLDNQEALINIGQRIPYAVPVTNGGATTQWTIEYIDAGVKLRITPQLGEAGYISTFIQPEVSSISEWRTTPAGDFPVISTRNACATVRVKDGESIVIGGLMSESKRENISRLPILGYLPLIGLAFQSRMMEKEKTEIVFLITPHVI